MLVSSLKCPEAVSSCISEPKRCETRVLRCFKLKEKNKIIKAGSVLANRLYGLEIDVELPPFFLSQTLGNTAGGKDC